MRVYTCSTAYMQNTYLVNSLLTFSAIIATTFIERGNVFLLRKKSYLYFHHILYTWNIHPGGFFVLPAGKFNFLKKY